MQQFKQAISDLVYYHAADLMLKQKYYNGINGDDNKTINSDIRVTETMNCMELSIPSGSATDLKYQ